MALPMQRSFVRIFEFCRHFTPSPMLLCGRIFLVAKFRLVSFPQIWEHTDCILEVLTFCIIPCDGPSSFRKFFCGATCPWRNFDVVIWSQFSSRRTDFLGWESWATQPNWRDSFSKGTAPFAPSFFDFLLGFSSASKCRKWQSLPKMHPVSDM